MCLGYVLKSYYEDDIQPEIQVALPPPRVQFNRPSVADIKFKLKI